MLSFQQLVAQYQPNVRECDWSNVLPVLAGEQPGLVIDVREDREWLTGMVPGTLHIARGVLEHQIAAYNTDPHTPLFLFCGGGYRSILAAHFLNQMGYTEVYSIRGGFRAHPGDVVTP